MDRVGPATQVAARTPENPARAKAGTDRSRGCAALHQHGVLQVVEGESQSRWRNQAAIGEAFHLQVACASIDPVDVGLAGDRGGGVLVVKDDAGRAHIEIARIHFQLVEHRDLIVQIHLLGGEDLGDFKTVEVDLACATDGLGKALVGDGSSA